MSLSRAIEALVLMGNPLFHGACSTLLGILLLGLSESFVFSVFFRMMVMVRKLGDALLERQRRGEKEKL